MNAILQQAGWVEITSSSTSCSGLISSLGIDPTGLTAMAIQHRIRSPIKCHSQLSTRVLRLVPLTSQFIPY